MNEKVPMLRDGYLRLEAELKTLKSVERPSVVQAIEEARAHGDLSENAEYHAAKERQGLIEGRIIELEGKLSRAQVIDPTSLSGDKVVFGATVTLIDEDDKEVVYQIVGADEGDVKAGKISYQSPIARALIGRNVGAEIEVKTPSGERYYELTDLKFI
ncbi:transcription elongation factor GreA [Gimibacter soli]|uniref:Transcription elongation factor GreA n=1 Tax=Gimibacter soli TaxID=3024400 RepID=A0AAE9XQ92_9PROT|nr:transcription elongation factor GreA [Gimibacter soli]WCL55197.1 transcription elongation factor GreA [Gimibacter soli]